jgi:septin 7
MKRKSSFPILGSAFPQPKIHQSKLGSTDRWKPIVDNIDSRFDAYLEQENRVNRSKLMDNRVHACIYFIQPTGHSCVSISFSFCTPSLIDQLGVLHMNSLRPIDIEFMRKLHHKVNLIPVIAKADTLTDDEVVAFKQRVRLSSNCPKVVELGPESPESLTIAF